MKNRGQRVYALKKMTTQLNTESIEMVKNKAILNQDYEFCEAIKIFRRKRLEQKK